MLPADDAALLIRADHVVAHGAGHAAHHRRPRRADELPEASARALLRAVAAALATPDRLTWPRCAPRWTIWRGRCAPRSSDMIGEISRMSVQEGDAAPDFEMPASGGRTVSLQGAARQAVRAVFLSEGRHARLHQGSLRVPGSAAAARPTSAST